MPPTRRKALRQTAPQTIEEATELLGRYAGIITEIERLRADADASIAAIQAARDGFVAPLEQAAKELFLQLRAWWGVAGEMLTEGKRKSCELAGCILGVRTTPPSLKMPAKDEEAALILQNAGFADFLRVKLSVDKPAVLKVLSAGQELESLRNQAANDAARELIDEIEARIARLRELGFKPKQKEEFFIDRAAPKPANPEEVEIAEAAE